MKKILFVGNANSFLIYQLAKQIKKVHPNWKIDILSEHLFELEESPYDSVFAVNHKHPNASRKYIKAWFLASEMKKLIREVNTHYDCVHILYLSSAYRFIWNDLKKVADKTIITVFGGDFYKSNFFMRLLMKKMVKEVQIISAPNPDTLRAFSEKFNIPHSKQRLVRFGLSILDEIDNLSNDDIHYWKVNQKISNDKILIACGYNKSANQNIPQIVNSIIQEKDLLPRIILCFQFPGEETEYTRLVIEELKRNKVDYRIFCDRFSDRELAIYRKAMNVMIQVQTSDSFSGAMQEHIYTGSIVITGKWLPYAFLDDQGVDYIRINSIKEVGTTIINSLDHKINLKINKSIIASYSKWSVTINSWTALYS